MLLPRVFLLLPRVFFGGLLHSGICRQDSAFAWRPHDEDPAYCPFYGVLVRRAASRCQGGGMLSRAVPAALMVTPGPGRQEIGGPDGHVQECPGRAKILWAVVTTTLLQYARACLTSPIDGVGRTRVQGGAKCVKFA